MSGHTDGFEKHYLEKPDKLGGWDSLMLVQAMSRERCVPVPGQLDPTVGLLVPGQEF